MKNIWKWILLFVAVFLVTLFISLPVLGRVMGNSFGIGMRSMMPRFFGWSAPMNSHMFGFGMFGGGLFMLGRLLIPLLLVALVVLGVLALVRRPGSVNAVPANAIPCPHCGKQIQNNWLACPYCGEKTGQG